MAIIRLDCNLNGGDSVTPNNELFYRIYGDVDAYDSPIWTTGTALSDANVTVDNDKVIITGVDGTTNTSFKIAAVDAAFNEGVLSDAKDSSSVVLGDTFSGTTIDTGKWEVIEPQPAIITFEQNDGILMSGTGVPSGIRTSQFLSLNAFDLDNEHILSMDIKSSVTTENYWYVGFIEDTDLTVQYDSIFFQSNATLNSIDTGFKINNVEQGNLPMAIDTSDFTTVKMIVNSTNVRWYGWNGSSWTLYETIARGGQTGSYRFMQAYYLASQRPVLTFKNLTISTSDFTTQYPSGITPI